MGARLSEEDKVELQTSRVRVILKLGLGYLLRSAIVCNV
jgi:hypothetical protein